MKTRVQPIDPPTDPAALAAGLEGNGVVLLESALTDPDQGRYSFLAAAPCLQFTSFGSRCVWTRADGRQEEQFGNPWAVLNARLEQFELVDGTLDLPFPEGGVFGYWGYDLKHFNEPSVTRRAFIDLELPDCHVGFYPSLIAWDHLRGAAWILATGLDAFGERSAGEADRQVQWWRACLETHRNSSSPRRPTRSTTNLSGPVRANVSREDYLAAVRAAKEYIRRGDIYQVNLARRLEADFPDGPAALYRRLREASPAPFSAWCEAPGFSILSSSPEQFLRMRGASIQTRPIKGTRPRSVDPDQDARFSYELQTSEKERAELVMITDLLRNDLGRICDFSTVVVPELLKLERYPQVQHLVSTVKGRLRPGLSHLEALAACFPGGSITGAPKIRAMQVIDELEPLARGPYTGCLGYLGFNRDSRLSILIRTAILRDTTAWFHCGAGIVADSDPQMEFEETEVKAKGFLEALSLGPCFPATASTDGELPKTHPCPRKDRAG